MHLTDLVVKSLPFQEIGQKDYIDDTLAGLTLRVGKRTKTFMLLVGSGKARKRHTLGKYPYLSLQDARKKARVIIGQREQAPQDTRIIRSRRRDARRNHLQSRGCNDWLHRAEGGSIVPTANHRTERRHIRA